MKRLGTILSIIVALMTLGGGLWALDARWSQSNQVNELKLYMVDLNNRLEAKIINDQITAIISRQWKLKDRHGEDVSKFPQSAKEEYRKLEKQKQELNIKLESILNKG